MESEERFAIDAARQCVYRFLSLALTDPRSARREHLNDPEVRRISVEAADLLRAEFGSDPHLPLARGERSPQLLDLRPVLSFLGPRDQMVLQHEAVFGLTGSKKAPPHESEYYKESLPIYRSQQVADVAGFYRAFALQPSREMPERHDHIALELEFMAFLIGKQILAESDDGGAERARICREAQSKFLQDHLAWWVPAFALLLRRASEGEPTPAAGETEPPPTTFYGAISVCLAAFIAAERAALGVAPPAEDGPCRPSAPTPGVLCPQP